MASILAPRTPILESFVFVLEPRIVIPFDSIFPDTLTFPATTRLETVPNVLRLEFNIPEPSVLLFKTVVPPIFIVLLAFKSGAETCPEILMTLAPMSIEPVIPAIDNPVVVPRYSESLKRRCVLVSPPIIY